MLVVRRLVRDLGLAVEIVGRCPLFARPMAWPCRRATPISAATSARSRAP